MSKVNVEDLDVYEILKLPDDCTTQDIKKAYRKAALDCHPDKHPDDQKAAEKFIQLSAILKLLLEPHSRNAYDALRKARLQNKLRLEKQDSKRKKLREDLERRERESALSKADTRSAEEKLRAEIERLRKESSRQLEEEVEAMRRMVDEELAREMEAQQLLNSGNTHRLKLKWKRAGPNYDSDEVHSIFSKYGTISALVMSKKGGSALLEFEDLIRTTKPVEEEHGLTRNPIDVTWVTRKPWGMCDENEPKYTEPPPEESGVDFEELVFERMREAQLQKDGSS